jgi:hypothetical protein
MGNYMLKGHKIWNWTYDLKKAKLYHWIGVGVADIYEPSLSTGLSTRANAWGRQLCNQQIVQTGDYCSVEQIDGNQNYRVKSYSPPPPPEFIPSTIWDMLEKWECTWIWEGINSVGEDTWIAEGVTNNTLLAVTDGSFMMKMYPNMSACAYVIGKRENGG